MQDFAQMTANEIASYRGPQFHATMVWRAADGSEIRSDITSTCRENEAAKIDALRDTGARLYRVEYGPLVLDNGLVIDRDINGSPKKDEPSKYTQVRSVGL